MNVNLENPSANVPEMLHIDHEKCSSKILHSSKKKVDAHFQQSWKKLQIHIKVSPPLFLSWAKKRWAIHTPKIEFCPPPSWATFCTHTLKNAQNVPLLRGPADGGKRVSREGL